MYLKKIENIQSFRNMQISSHLQELFKNCRVKAKILVFPVPWLSLLRLFVNMNMGSYPQDLISICGNIIYQVFATYLWSFPIYSSCVQHMLFSPSKFSNLYNAGFCCLYSIIGTTPYVCVCSYNNHMYILKQCNWFLDCQTSSMIKILIQVVSL